MSSSKREQFTAARDTLLMEITAFLKNDPRFSAAWLAGSFGRGEQNWLSDLDIHVVVAKEYSDVLCATGQTNAGRTTPERLELVQQFGTPTILFESHGNNQIGGTFTHVVYRETAQNIDWMLIPQHKAYLEQPALLLFDKIGLPEEPKKEPLSREKAVTIVSDSVSFFWMIASGSAKDINGDLIQFHNLLSWLRGSLRRIKYAFEFQEPPFVEDKQEVGYTLSARATMLRQLCNEMEVLTPKIIEFGGVVPLDPRAIVEKRLALFEE